MEKISAVILCGGKSSRMGTDKANLLIGEETFLEHIQKNLAGAGAGNVIRICQLAILITLPVFVIRLKAHIALFFTAA